MTSSERPKRDDLPSNEGKPTVQLRYTPLGHNEQLLRIRNAWQEAINKAAELASAVPGEIRNAVQSSVMDGTEATVDDPTGSIAAYHTALQLSKNYRDAFQGEQEIADAFLMRLSEPYFVEPPSELWGVVGSTSEEGLKLPGKTRVPFTQSEIEAIGEARKARGMVAELGKIDSGAARDFWTESQLFPEEIQRGPLTYSMTDRPTAIWGIMMAARAAENALTLHIGTAGEPEKGVTKLLATVRDLPDKLIRHRPTPAI